MRIIKKHFYDTKVTPRHFFEIQKDMYMHLHFAFTTSLKLTTVLDGHGLHSSKFSRITRRVHVGETNEEENREHVKSDNMIYKPTSTYIYANEDNRFYNARE